MTIHAIERWRPQRNEIYHMDAAVFLDHLEPNSVPLFITSPPYNLRNSTGGVFRNAATAAKSSLWRHAAIAEGYDGHDDNMPRAEYVRWQREILAAMVKALSPDGAIFYNHKARVQAGGMESPDEITCGFPVRQRIIWDRGSGMNFNDTYFVPSYEFIYLIAKPEFRLRKGANGIGDVWTFPPDTHNPHPAAFPVTLPLRILDSVNADHGVGLRHLVVDPFGGSGTVAAAARQKRVDYMLCDLSPAYVEMARQRLRLPYMLNMFENLRASE